MKKWLGLVALTCFAQVYSDADLLNFDAPNLGIPWNARTDELADWLPGLKQSTKRSAGYRGSVRVTYKNSVGEGYVVKQLPDGRS